MSKYRIDIMTFVSWLSFINGLILIKYVIELNPI